MATKTTRRAGGTVRATRPRGDLNRSGSNRDEIAWACLPGIYAAGTGIHMALTKHGSAWHWVLVEACILASTALIGWRLWLMMGPRDRRAREDVTAAFTVAGVGLAGTVIWALRWEWLVIYASFGVAVVLIFNAHMSRRVKGDGRDEHRPGLDASALGLAEGTTVKPDPSDPSVIHIHHAEGEDTSVVRSLLTRWESMRKLRPGSLMTRVGKHRGHTIVQVVDTTTLDKPVPWPGPSRPGGSIAEPLRVGKWADGDLVESVWREHSLTMGVTGSGKTSSGSLVKVTEMLTRRDVVVLWCDPIKGIQSAGPVAGGVTWAATTEAEARAMVAALIRAIPARTADLASKRDKKHPKGYTKWEPDAWTLHGIPLVYAQFEEAAWLVDHGALVKVAERARSAGIYFDMSLQRASHSRLDTDVRANLTRRVCFGVMDKEDAGFVLGDRVLDAGADPAVWEDRQPGMAILQARDVPDRKQAMPMRWFMATRNGGRTEDLTVLGEVVAGHADVRAQLDPVTVAAFGPAYQAWLQARDQDPELSAGVSAPTQTPGHEEDLSGVDDLDMEPIEGDEDPMPLPVTDGVDLTGIDPNAEDQDPSADDVDLGDLTASRLSTEERNERFRAMLADRWARGQTVVSQTELSNEWHEIPGGGGKPWPYMRLNRLARIGGPGGSPLVSRDEQEPSMWHVNSDPGAWTAEAVTIAGSDLPQAGDDD